MEAWEPRHAAVVDELPRLRAEKKVALGQAVFKWVEQDASFPLRSVRERFLTHGSYHILSNRFAVGWHPDFKASVDAEGKKKRRSRHATWSNRVVEEANLFNPAFCAVPIAQTSEDYSKRAQHAMPFPLAFLSLPIVLHRATREALPNSTVTSLLPWVQDNREQLVDFAKRVQRLREVTREAVLFATQNEFLSVDAEGGLSVGPKRKTATERRTECSRPRRANALTGPASSGVGSPPLGHVDNFSSWGVAP